jgi:uridine phosphorylase
VAITANLHVGGPATAIIVEELAACGILKVIAVDIAGSLDPRLRSGTVVLAEGAICGDGTSRNYAPDSQPVGANSELAARVAAGLREENVDFAPGLVWSTDAPFRETRAQVDAFSGRGAGLVDMETAALYAAAAALGVSTASILVVADELFDGWRPPADMAAIQSRLNRVARVAAECLRG